MGETGAIAAIEPHPTRRNFYTLHITGREAVILHEDVIVALELRVGRMVGDEVARAIAREVRVADAREAALRLLRFRPRSRMELARALNARGFAEGVVEAALAKLENLRLVDDELFARDLAQSLLRRHPYGKDALLQRLTEAGVAAEVAEGAVSEALEGIDEARRALQALEQQLARWEDLPTAKRRSRAGQFLSRLGYDPDVIADALCTALADD